MAADIELVDSDFEVRLGESTLIGHALDHSPADILRELVQNEYDAGGSSIEVSFKEESLVVTGNGMGIDSRGWKRLTVIWGAGAVLGTNERVDPKPNSIGSKNVGLKSLFLFGDQIMVSSNGRRTVLDRTKGSLKVPRQDPASKGVPGVRIEVPYRQISMALPAFDTVQEASAMESIVNELAGTLVKLSRPKGDNLKNVVVRSTRLDHELRWSQSARVPAREPTVLRRRVSIEQRGTLLQGVPPAISETEFLKFVQVPSALRGYPMASYFRAGGGRVRIGVSLRTNGKKIDLSEPGIFYYPLGANRAFTGFPFSVNAPWDMSLERTAVVAPPHSPWNSWLVEEVAGFVTNLVGRSWFNLYGASAFRAVNPDEATSATLLELPNRIEDLLRSESCWPSAQLERRRPVLSKVSTLNVGDDPALRDLVHGVLASGVTIHRDLERDAAARELAIKLGAKRFTLSSLIRLRCVGGDVSSLATKLDTARESNFSYTNFPAPLEELAAQECFAVALEDHRDKLSRDHRRDLQVSPTTLTAAGTLAAPDLPLLVVDDSLSGTAPKEQTLHPALADFRVLANLCERRNVSQWTIEKAKAIQSGKFDKADRDILNRYLMGRPELSRDAWRVVRQSPVLYDKSGEWACPSQMIPASLPGVAIVEPALHVVPTGIPSDLAKKCGFRKKVTGSDLVNLAELTEQGEVDPERMNVALQRLTSLLTDSVVRRLRELAFLKTTSGELVTPSDAYIPAAEVMEVLGEEAPFATGVSTRILRRLGCKCDPSVEDILRSLERMRESGVKPPRPEAVYRVLRAAVRAERYSVELLAGSQILLTNRGWETPDECLVGPDMRKIFVGGVTVLRDSPGDPWRTLGVRTEPSPIQWRRLFEWIAQSNPGGARVSLRVYGALERAYRSLDAAPEGLHPSTCYLLDEDRRLHSPAEAAADKFVINDHPVLADALRDDGAGVSFAPVDWGFAEFYSSAGVKRLSDVAQILPTELGEAQEPGPNLKPSVFLEGIKSEEFASALHALATSLSSPKPVAPAPQLAQRLEGLVAIEFVSTISRRWKVAGATVAIDSDHDLDTTRIILVRHGARSRFKRSLGAALADLVDPEDGERLLADAIYFLLDCKNVVALQRELARKRIPWAPPGGSSLADLDEEDDEDGVFDALSDSMERALHAGRPEPRQPSPTPATQATPTPHETLPDFDAVVAAPAISRMPVERAGDNGLGRGSSGGSTPRRTPEEAARDLELGRRAEEIVVDIERERVMGFGGSADDVYWISENDPYADHDIRSVDEDGEPLWVEVKATVGRDGRFAWPISEFSLASRVRSQYVLYRVYEARSDNPKYATMRDPIGELETGRLLIEMDQLIGDVGSLETE